MGSPTGGCWALLFIVTDRSPETGPRLAQGRKGACRGVLGVLPYPFSCARMRTMQLWKPLSPLLQACCDNVSPGQSTYPQGCPQGAHLGACLGVRGARGVSSHKAQRSLIPGIPRVPIRFTSGALG